LATVTLINPIAAVAIGLGLLNERYSAGVGGLIVAALAATMSTYGVILLSRASPIHLPPQPASGPPSRARQRRTSTTR
jgi:hypothetical protein